MSTTSTLFPYLCNASPNIVFSSLHSNVFLSSLPSILSTCLNLVSYAFSAMSPTPNLPIDILTPATPLRSVHTLLPTTSSFLPFQRKQARSHCHTEERKGRRYRLGYRTGNTSQLKISLTFLQRKIFLFFQPLHTGGHDNIRMDGTFS